MQLIPKLSVYMPLAMKLADNARGFIINISEAGQDMHDTAHSV